MKNSYSGFALLKISLKRSRSKSRAMNAGDMPFMKISANSRLRVSTTLGSIS